MTSERGALAALEVSFRRWYRATGQDAPDVGILVIGLSRDGCDLQYIGIEPHAVIDWPDLFARILEQLQAGAYTVNDSAEVPFKRQF